MPAIYDLQISTWTVNQLAMFVLVASFAIQQGLQVFVNPLVTYLAIYRLGLDQKLSNKNFRWSDLKRSLMGFLSLFIAFFALGFGNAFFLSKIGLSVGVFWDHILSALLISSGADGSNTVAKLLGYVKQAQGLNVAALASAGTTPSEGPVTVECISYGLPPPGTQINLGNAVGAGCYPSAKFRGSTAHLSVFSTVDFPNGLVQHVFAAADGLIGAVQQLMGIDDAGLFNVIFALQPVDHGSHAACDGRNIYCELATLTGDMATFLTMAEIVEVLGNDNWNCLASDGEALSRIVAADAHAASTSFDLGRSPFASAASWLNSQRADFVNNHSGDTDTVAVGCSVLFIRYLQGQLNVPLKDIANAQGLKLVDKYASLLPSIGGSPPPSEGVFNHFSCILKKKFPPARSGPGLLVPGDNPFAGGPLNADGC